MKLLYLIQFEFLLLIYLTFPLNNGSLFVTLISMVIRLIIQEDVNSPLLRQLLK
jgi:hypothetical protein